MRIDDFTLENWLNPACDSEKNKYYLGGSCVLPMTVEDLFDLTGESMENFFEELKHMNLGYPRFEGTPRTRKALSKLYKAVEPDEVILCHGGTGANATVCYTLIESTDNIISIMPNYQQFYSIPRSIGAELREVDLKIKDGYKLDLSEVRAAVDKNTKAILFTNPNNPTGVVYSAGTLTRMAEILTEKSRAFGHNIFLVSDEPYRDIAFDGKKVPYPAAFYPHTLTCFSFSKSLSLPGERLGYVAVRPGCEGEEVLVDMMAQISRFTGHNCPPSIIQRAVSRCLDVTSDLSVYETNMDLLYNKLKALGFEVERPGGTFYLFPKALEEDANAFCRRAREFDLLLVPSDTFGVTGYVRLAYCIDTEKVKRSLPALEKLAAAYQ